MDRRGLYGMAEGKGEVMGYQCFHCGQNSVYWQADFTFEDYGMEGDGIIHVCHCVNCGADIEYYVPLKEESDEDL